MSHSDFESNSAANTTAKQPIVPHPDGTTDVLSNSALAGLAAADLLSAADLFTQVSGHQVLKELGRGGAGIVLLSKHGITGRLEVLKFLNPVALERRPELRDRFLREIRSAALLDHENIIRVYGAYQREDRLILIMEYGDGEDLFELVRQNGPLPVTDACDYISQTAAGLQYALEMGMVHRDIKPQNLLLIASGRGSRIKILDFGTVKVDQTNGLTRYGSVVGTPAYMAPEQARNPARADIRADIYSLGCTLYYLLTGSAPFVGKTYFDIIEAHSSSSWKPLRKWRPDVDPALDAVLTKMLAKKPANRLASPMEVIFALEPFIRRRVNASERSSRAASESPRSTSPDALRKRHSADDDADWEGQCALTQIDSSRSNGVKVSGRSGLWVALILLAAGLVFACGYMALQITYDLGAMPR